MMPVYKDERFGGLNLPPEFWANVLRTPSCWLWVGGKTAQGYGRISLDRVSDGVHRTILGMHGVKTPGYVPDHLCGVRNCCNPDDLEVVTHAENLRRGNNHWRSKTHCPSGHEYTGANTLLSNGRRNCKECRRLYYLANRTKLLAGMKQRAQRLNNDLDSERAG